jgi:hypothetical protein
MMSIAARRLAAIALLTTASIGCSPSPDDAADDAGADGGEAGTDATADGRPDGDLDTRFEGGTESGESGLDTATIETTPESDVADTFDATLDDASEGGTDIGSDGGDGETADAGTGTFIADPAPCGRSLSPVPGEVLDVGHVNGALLEQSADRLLSRDATTITGAAGPWFILWNTTTRVRVASGESTNVHLAGATLAVQTTSNVELRNAADGALRATVPITAYSGLASDGTYLYAASAAKLSAYSTATGALLFEKLGNYSTAKIYAAPGELRVAAGPAATSAIELIATSTGASTITPSYAYAFNTWFEDGNRFATNLGNTVQVYSKNGVSAGLVALPAVNKLHGQGDYLWIVWGRVNVYRVGGSATPVATYYPTTDPVPGANNTMALQADPALDPDFKSHVDIITLGATISKVTVALPRRFSGLAYAGDSSGNWSMGLSEGAIYDSHDVGMTPWPSLTCGALYQPNGATTGRFAVGTAAKGIVVGDALTTSKTILGTLPFTASNVAISGDGLTLGAQAEVGYSKETSGAKVFALPGGSVLGEFTWDATTGAIKYIALARGGTRFGRTFEGPPVARYVTDVSGSTTEVSDTTSYEPTRISPDGTLVALSTSPRSTTVTTRIYKRGALVAAVAGWAVGWLDDTRLLVNTYHAVGPLASPTFTDARIYASDGTYLSTTGLPEIYSSFGDIAVVSATRVYSSNHNAIFDLTGAKVWSGPTTIPLGRGTVAGGFVLYQLDHRIIAEAY